MNQKTFTTTFAGKELTIEFGKFANAANGSCTVRMGDTVVLVTAVMSEDVRPGMGFFPLMVDYEEKLYAAGRIKGSRFIKREGRPTDEAVLVARFIDRAIRPLFDTRIQNDIQVIATALSFDGEHDPDILGLIGASCALHVSDIPWNGPIGAVRVSKVGNELLFNPTYSERETSLFDLDLAGRKNKLVNIETRADEVVESELVEAFAQGGEFMESLAVFIEQIRTEIGKPKRDLFSAKTEEEKQKQVRAEEIKQMAREFMRPQIQELFFAFPKATKGERSAAKKELSSRLKTHLVQAGLDKDEVSIATGIVYDFLQDEISRMIVEEGKRVDGRGVEEVRALVSEVALLPRVHGSGHFMRGETQVLSVCTLGAPGDQQTLDGMELVGEKRYMHHYNFPPYSVGEAKPLRGAGRREVGHGALAEKAVERMMPSKEDFPYTVRVVSEVFGSNGSSSMASTCGSTLALMDAGVPIKAAVAGVAIGLASTENKWKVITDLQDLEDGNGGMDFKVTGSETGVTAIQMDTKTQGISHEMVVEALRQARNGRLTILETMKKAIAKPRAELSPYAPRITNLRINPDKIREVIGPGGKMINEIISKTGVETIDIEQDGLVLITAKNQEAGKAAEEWIIALTKEVEAGELYTGKVTRLMDFGAFVEVLPGKEGLVHISEMAPWRVAKVDDIVSVGKEVFVKVKEIDDMKRINLTMKDVEGNVYTEEMKAKAQTGAPEERKPRPQGGKPPFKRQNHA